MPYLIFFLSLVSIFALTRAKPMNDWAKSLKKKPAASILLIVVFASLFLGGVQDTASDELAIPGGVRLVRFLVFVSLFFLVAIRLLGNLNSFRYAGAGARFMLLYAAIAMFSATYSVSPLISLWKGFEVFVIVLVGIYLASQLKQWEDLQWLNNILMLLMLYFVFSALFGLILVPGEAFTKPELSSALVMRGLAPPINANTLTQFSALLAVLALPYALDAEKRKGIIWVWFIMALAITTMLLGHSRTSIFATILAVGGILYFGRRRLIAIFFAVLGVAAFAMTEIVMEYIRRGQSEEVFLSLTGRTHYWEHVWQTVIESPIFGHGFYAAQRTIFGTSSVDNTYLEVLLGLGIIGLTVFVIPVATVAMQLLFSIPRRSLTKMEKILWLQLMALFVLLFVRSTTGPSFQVMHPNLVMFMLLLIGVQAYRRLRTRQSAVNAEARPSSQPKGGPKTTGKVFQP